MKLNDIINQIQHEKFATQTGAHVHVAMRHVVLGDDGDSCGDAELVARVRAHSELVPLFHVDAQTEVPVAGYINGTFISRRIDRMRVFDDTRRVVFVDYKTDVNPDNTGDRYRRQLTEYAQLLAEIYPDYQIEGYILWLHNWMVTPVVKMCKKS